MRTRPCRRSSSATARWAGRSRRPPRREATGSRSLGRPPGAPRPDGPRWRRPGRRCLAGWGGRRERRGRARCGHRPVRHRHDRLDGGARRWSRRASRIRRKRGRRLELQPRGRALRPSGGGRDGPLRRRRRVRPVSRRVASTGQGATGRPGRRSTSPAGWRSATRVSRRRRPRDSLHPCRRSPGMHLVGFDAAGETVELRITARDRTAYAAGVLAAAEWLRAGRAIGRHPRLRCRRRRPAHPRPADGCA